MRINLLFPAILLNIFVLLNKNAKSAENEAALANFFTTETQLIEGKLAHELKSKEDFERLRLQYRNELWEMLGLSPQPERGDLKPVITGQFEHAGVIVEKLHFQSIPGLYVTANLYRPKEVTKPLPTVLYLCGHADKVKDGVSYGNKTGYGHHGLWYAQHGFVCLVVDTVQLGELRGEHQGTYRLGRWWWASRGYTPAGVEAWTGIRALDYLETRPEVDAKRFGVAGRSGGGAYSWWVVALDDRIQCATPTAGITTMHNHVVDNCIEGHCDCMFMVNAQRWDFDKLAVLAAPRPLCILNTDKDSIFPLDGVVNVHRSVRRVYQLLGAEDKLGFHIAEGPHKNMQPLNTGEFHWMMRHLQGADLMSTYDQAAVSDITVEKLRVFEQLPADQLNTTIDKNFVPVANADLPVDEGDWQKKRETWMQNLKGKVFNRYQADDALKHLENSQLQVASSHTADGLQLTEYTLKTQSPFDIGQPKLILIHREGIKAAELDLVVLNVLDNEGWNDVANTFSKVFPEAFHSETSAIAQSDDKALESEKQMHQQFKWGMAYFCPAGVGSRAWEGTVKEQTHRLRRFHLLGQTLESHQSFEIRRFIRGLRSVEGLKETKLWVQAARTQSANAVYASLFEDGITRLDLHDLPTSHMPSEVFPIALDSKQAGEVQPTGAPVYLNILKYMDIPQALALASERTRVIIYSDDESAWAYPQKTSELLQWTKEKGRGLQIRPLTKQDIQEGKEARASTPPPAKN